MLHSIFTSCLLSSILALLRVVAYCFIWCEDTLACYSYISCPFLLLCAKVAVHRVKTIFYKLKLTMFPFLWRHCSNVRTQSANCYWHIYVFVFFFPKTSGITCLYYYYSHWQHLFDFVGMTIVIGLLQTEEVVLYRVGECIFLLSFCNFKRLSSRCSLLFWPRFSDVDCVMCDTLAPSFLGQL